MKAVYRGFEIEAKRERCLGGWEQMYFTAYRISDGYEHVCGFSDCADTEETYMEVLRSRIDEFYEETCDGEGRWSEPDGEEYECPGCSKCRTTRAETGS